MKIHRNLEDLGQSDPTPIGQKSPSPEHVAVPDFVHEIGAGVIKGIQEVGAPERDTPLGWVRLNDGPQSQFVSALHEIALPEIELKDIIDVVRTTARKVWLKGDHPSSHEAGLPKQGLLSVVAPGSELIPRLPRLMDLYTRDILEALREFDTTGQADVNELAHCLLPIPEWHDTIVTGNVFLPGMRMEAHHDVFPLGANLYLQGKGDLAITLKTSTRSFDEIAANATFRVSPEPGLLSLLRLTEWPHTVLPADDAAPLGPGGDVDLDNDELWANARIALNFNYVNIRFGLEHGLMVDTPVATASYILGQHEGSPAIEDATKASSRQLGELVAYAGHFLFGMPSRNSPQQNLPDEM